MAWHDRLTEEVNEIFEQLGGCVDRRDIFAGEGFGVIRLASLDEEADRKRRTRLSRSRNVRVTGVSTAGLRAETTKRIRAAQRRGFIEEVRRLRSEGYQIAAICGMMDRSRSAIQNALRAAA